MECPFINLTSKVQPETLRGVNILGGMSGHAEKNCSSRQIWSGEVSGTIWELQCESVFHCVNNLKWNLSQNWNQHDKTIRMIFWKYRHLKWPNILVCYQFSSEIIWRRDQSVPAVAVIFILTSFNTKLRSIGNILVPTGISVQLSCC